MQGHRAESRLEMLPIIPDREWRFIVRVKFFVFSVLVIVILNSAPLTGMAQDDPFINAFLAAGDNLSPSKLVFTRLFSPDDDINVLMLFSGDQKQNISTSFNVVTPDGESLISDMDVEPESRWAVLGFDRERRNRPWPAGDYTATLLVGDASFDMTFQIDERLTEVDEAADIANFEGYYTLWQLETVAFGPNGEYQFAFQVPFSWALADTTDERWHSAAEDLAASSDFRASYIAAGAQTWEDLAIDPATVVPQPRDEGPSLVFRPQPWWVETSVANQTDLSALPFMSLNNYIEGDFTCSLIEQQTASDIANGEVVEVVYWGDGPYDCAQRNDQILALGGTDIHAVFYFVPDPETGAGYMWFIAIPESSYDQIAADIARIFGSLRVLQEMQALPPKQ